jgi:hypothetical protein
MRNDRRSGHRAAGYRGSVTADIVPPVCFRAAVTRIPYEASAMAIAFVSCPTPPLEIE